MTVVIESHKEYSPAMSKTIVEDKLKVDCDAVIHEIELDSTWRENYSEPFRKYRKDFEVLKENNPMGDDLPDFPISIEIESSYFCNLKCPFCPRVVNEGEREIKHIPEELWEKILNEIRENNLPSLLMDHEGESLMNPKLISMIKQAKEAGVLDIWLHTNGNLLYKKKAEELIDAGLTKVNFSIDAGKPNTYEVLRLGGKLDKVTKYFIENIQGVISFVGPKAKRPTPLRDTEIKKIFGEVESKEGREMIVSPFSKNDSVKIIAGPFIDFTGVVEEINDEKQKVKITISIFGRSTPVELDYFQVEAEK